MNQIKYFLKPNKNKILVFFILFVLFVVFGIQVASSNVVTTMCPREGNFNAVIFPFHSIFGLDRLCDAGGIINHFYNFFLRHIPLVGWYFNSIHFLIAIATLFYWYIVTCVIIWLFYKFKKKSI